MPLTQTHTKYVLCMQSVLFFHLHTITPIQSFLIYCLLENSVFILWVIQLSSAASQSLHDPHGFQRAVIRESTIFSSIFAPSLSPLWFLQTSWSPTTLFFSPIQLRSLTSLFHHTQTRNGTRKNWLAQSPQLPGPLSSPLLHQPRCTLPLCPPFDPLLNCSTSPPSTPQHPPSLSRPEAAAATCIAGCYVGAMTTVMNSTWRSRIQADVELCGCSAPNGTHVSREWNSQRGGGAGGSALSVDVEGFFFSVVFSRHCMQMCMCERVMWVVCACIFMHHMTKSKCHEFSCVTFPYREILFCNMRV